MNGSSSLHPYTVTKLGESHMNHSLSENDGRSSESLGSISRTKPLLQTGPSDDYFYENFIPSLEYDSDDCDAENIYENLTKLRPKQKSFQEFMQSVKSKAKDLRFIRHGRKRKTKLIESNLLIDDNLFGSERSLMESYWRNYDDVSSYTSCHDENIYENLDFKYSCIYERDAQLLQENDSLNFWVRNLSNEIENYENETILCVKSIPSRIESFNCCYNMMNPNWGIQTGAMIQRPLNDDAIRYELFRKVYTSSWAHDDESEMLNSMIYIYNKYLRNQKTRDNATDDRNTIMRTPTTTTETDMIVDSPETFTSIDTTSVILSSLNPLMITYDDCLKFYFALATFHSIDWCCVRKAQIYKFSKLFIKNNAHQLRLITDKQLISFCHSLKLILSRAALKWKAHEIKAIESDEKVIEESPKFVQEESIYQPIWKCKTSACDTIKGENIYAQFDFMTAPVDDNEWEIDDEFSFVVARENEQKIMNESDVINTPKFSKVCILYSDEDENLNKILYSYDSTSFIGCVSADKVLLSSESHDTENESHVELAGQALPLAGFEKFDSVEAWKFLLLKDSNFLEDEEDMIMTESILNTLSNNSRYDYEDTSSINSGNSISNDLKHKNKNKLLLMKNRKQDTSVSSDSLTDNSIHGQYRPINEIDFDSSEQIHDEPKKERERFRDRVKAKLKFKSSKPPPQPEQNKEDTISTSSEDLGKFTVFGCSLDQVEKDIDHKDVPRFIVECTKLIEIHVKCHGLYRISGNKTIIEAVRKKLNEKKTSKKESKYAVLQGHDIHTLCGLLKMYFRELPPLISGKTFNFCTSDNVTIPQIRDQLRTEVPHGNYETLKFLLSHLKNIEKHSDENLMTAANIAICWGLCLFSSCFDQSPGYENDICKCNVLCKKLIDNFYDIFQNVPIEQNNRQI